MSSKKINVAIIFGGKSAEHEISLQSAKNVYDAIDKEKYNPILIGIDKKGRWVLQKNDNVGCVNFNKIDSTSPQIHILPGEGLLVGTKENLEINVAFPILHGPLGEDGTVQGLLKLANIPFVGAGVLGSAVGMDKEIMKRLFRDEGIPIAKFLIFKKGDKLLKFSDTVESLGLPFFVKPANMGSSVGVSKVTTETEYKKALFDAFKYDNKIIVEEFIKGREIECGGLGNFEVIASIPGEIIPLYDFYSYESKYIDKDGAKLEIPAKISKETVAVIKNLTIKTFKLLSCEGLGRVDFFLKENGEVIINEINTIPGFTKISMYPKLWEASGISYTNLIDKLIQFAIERFKNEEMLESNYSKSSGLESR